jgi:hypothetical protein
MTKRTKSNRHRQSKVAIIALAALMFAAHIEVAAQDFKPGDKVMASPLALKDEKYYRPCTVVKFERTANAYFLDCEGTEYTVPPAYVRAAKNEAVAGEEKQAVVEKPKDTEAKPTDSKGQFKVGDRVLASVSGLKAEKYYQPCTVIRGLKDNAYGLKCDPRNGQPFMEYSVRPEWIKVWANATPEPSPAECPFNKNYGKVSNSAPASAALFKSVIFEWRRSTSDFYDFGLTFQDFKMGSAFKNVATGRGRKRIDTAPLGATIYPVKTKELMCQKSSTTTQRQLREIEYDCYKSQFDEWVCKQGAPKNLEPPTKIPNK